MKEGENEVLIHKQLEAMEQLAKQEDFTLCLNIFTKKRTNLYSQMQTKPLRTTVLGRDLRSIKYETNSFN